MKLSATPEADRLATVIDGLDQCIRNARDKCTTVQQKDGSGGTMSVEKPAPDYATEFKCWVAIATLWNLNGGKGGAPKSAMAAGHDADPDDLDGASEEMFGSGH